MVETGAPGVVAGRLEDRADLPGRGWQLGVLPALERRGPAARCYEPEQHPQGGGLSGPVGSEQGRHVARCATALRSLTASTSANRLVRPRSSMLIRTPRR